MVNLQLMMNPNWDLVLLLGTTSQLDLLASLRGTC